MKEMPKHVYISGPMRGHDDYNFPAFFEAEAHLKGLWPETDICNPAREDVVRFSLQRCLATDPTGRTAGLYLAEHPDLFTTESLHTALGHDLDYICRHADLLVMLPGWKKSKGALAEVAAAQALGLTVVEYDTGAARRPVEPLNHDPAVEEWAEALRGAQRPASASPAARSADEVRTTSATGGEKGSKLAAFDQISPEVEWLVAEHFGKGARKYSAHNFRKGYPWSLSYSALRRHLAEFWAGKEYDICPEGGAGCSTWEGEMSEHGPVCINHTGSLHIVAVIWHAMVLTEFFLHQKEYDDRYAY